MEKLIHSYSNTQFWCDDDGNHPTYFVAHFHHSSFDGQYGMLHLRGLVSLSLEFPGPSLSLGHLSHPTSLSLMLGTLKWTHFQVQTKSIEKQLHGLSEVLLPLPGDTQPTRSSLAVIFWASARAEKVGGGGSSGEIRDYS
jgi:hypothetical protein